MDMNSDARSVVNRWRFDKKHAERRILRFDERVTQRLEAILQRSMMDMEPLDGWEIRQAYYRDIGEYEYIDDDWRTIRLGEYWGGKDVSAFFRRPITIPDRMGGQVVALHIYVGGDSLLKLDGVPYHGLDPFRHIVQLTDAAEPGETHLLELESYIHWYTSKEYLNLFQQAELVVIDKEVEAAYWDFVAAFKVLFMKDIDASLKAFLEKHVWDALLAVPVHEPDHQQFKQGLLEAQSRFRREVYSTDHFHVPGVLHLAGHSHLDIVYVWPFREYIRKVGRTHATMLRLMEQYPDFKFSQSSSKIYADMKEHYPGIYEQVKQRIAEGRWQPVGAFWVEPDCNLISGESLVRQILHGQRFWKEEFGFQSRVCWEPDVFGMTWALPQILKRSGIDVVMCNKLVVWNDTNPWTQNTFFWEGPDGTQILTVFPPGHFIGMVDPDHMNQYWRDFSDKETIGEMLYTYGWGDGGGGVDPEMIESAIRYADFPGVVPTTFAHPEESLLSILDKSQNADLPIWRDELYLEAHRGTYTSKGHLKKLNRQSEVLYRQVEMLAALAWCTGGDYPEEDLDIGWKMLLTTQFHDALPGTHITEVYHYLLDEYDKIRDIAQRVRQYATNRLFGGEGGENVLIFNPLSSPIGGL
jgi:alpha-mannosidase